MLLFSLRLAMQKVPVCGEHTRVIWIFIQSMVRKHGIGITSLSVWIALMYLPLGQDCIFSFCLPPNSTVAQNVFWQHIFIAWVDRLCHDKSYRLLELQSVIQHSAELFFAWQGLSLLHWEQFNAPLLHAAVLFPPCQTNNIFECTFIAFIPHILLILLLHRKIYGYRLIILPFVV